MAGQITIDEPTLTKLEGIYADAQSQAELRLGLYTHPAVNGVPAVRENLSSSLPVKAGDKGFTPGANLLTGVDQVRTGLADRVTQFKADAYNLHWGLSFLLQDTAAADSFNSMTAAQFGSYIPQAAAS